MTPIKSSLHFIDPNFDGRKLSRHLIAEQRYLYGLGSDQGDLLLKQVGRRLEVDLELHSERQRTWDNNDLVVLRKILITMGPFVFAMMSSIFYTLSGNGNEVIIVSLLSLTTATAGNVAYQMLKDLRYT